MSTTKTHTKLPPGTDGSTTVPPGYNWTEVGVIPKEWEVHSLEEITDPKRPICYGIVQVGPFVSSGIPVLTINDLNTDYCTNIHRCSPEIEAPYARSRVRSRDILISVKGTTGRVGIIPSHFVGNISRDLARIRLSDENVPEFWFQMLQSETVQRELDLATVGTTRLELSIGILKQVRVPRPPFGVQIALAEVLSDVDGLIGALDKLIAKKRAIKRGAMQQLLTGKTRLPGFSGEWDSAPLSDLCIMETGRRPRGGVTEEGDVPSLGGENIYNSNGLRLDVIKRVSYAFFASMRSGILQELDIIINKDGANTGKVALYVGSGFTHACVNEHLFLLRARPGVNARFLFSMLCLASIQNEINKHIASSAQPGLNRKFFKVVDIPVPEIREQQVIATVLSDMDAEIAALEQRRDKTKQIKQGMLQQLLTGRVRLVRPQVPVAEAESTLKGKKAHNWQFNEAVVISVLVNKFGTEQYPLGRMRYTKLSYLFHRHEERQVEGYLKKAAGPYNPRTKYGGPEKIALKNGYVREHTSGKFRGFVVADNISQAEDYFDKWYGSECVQWLEQFRFKKNDELELLTTVDMAVEELRAAQKDVDVEGVKNVIRSHPEWQAKLDRPVFSDASITQTIKTCRTLFD